MAERETVDPSLYLDDYSKPGYPDQEKKPGDLQTTPISPNSNIPASPVDKD